MQRRDVPKQIEAFMSFIQLHIVFRFLPESIAIESFFLFFSRSNNYRLVHKAIKNFTAQFVQSGFGHSNVLFRTELQIDCGSSK